MSKHILTKTYTQLKGFSTDSPFVRSADVAEQVVNMQRLADGTFAPRRGYQAQTAGIGGLGVSIYENRIDQETQDVCVNHDGNLYKKRKGTITIAFAGASAHEYISFMIFVDPADTSDTQTCDFDPYAIVSENALVDDCICFLFQKLTVHTGIAIGTGSATYAGVLPGFPLTPGTIVMTDGTLTIQDDAVGGFTGNTGVGANIINYTTGAYSVTFSGVTTPVTASYRGTLQTQFLQSMGKGFGVAAPYLISSLVTLIGGVAGVTVTTTGNTLHPGAFIEIREATIVPNGKSVVLDYFYWEECNRTVPVTFSGLLAHLATPEFQNATFAAYQEVIYIADPWDEVQKFDGQTVYRAGMPKGSTPSLANGGGGNVDIGPHTYFTTYEQVDANGRRVEGTISTGALITLVGASIVNVTYDNLLQGSGWNTDGAIIVGTQVGVNTIVVQSPHSVEVGDTAFFIDSVTKIALQRLVLTVSVNTITIDGAPVTVSDVNDWESAISNNLKINIWRTIAPAGTEPTFVASIPNNSYQATTTYDDNKLDSATGITYPTPQRRPDPPPMVGIVFSYRNQLIFTQDPVNDDYVWFSDPDGPEYVSSEITRGNNFIVPSNDDDVSGVGQAGGTLVIFKGKSIYSVGGELPTSQFVVNPVAPGSNIGCVAHATICSVGSLLYFLHTNGVYAMSENTIFPTDQFGNPIPLSIPIDQIFRSTNVQTNQQFQLRRACAVNYTKDNQYLLFLPAEEDEGYRFANDYSRVLCYDYQGKNWFEWTRVNAAGGFYVTQDNLYWQNRRPAPTGITSETFKQHRKYRLIDQVDHVTPIRVTWTSSWEDVGQPRVRKKFVRAALLFDNISAIFQVNRPELCFTSYVDWKKGVRGKNTTRSDITTQIESTAWNRDPWDWTEWSGYQDTFVTVPLKGGTVAKSMQLQIQINQLNASFSLQGFQLEVAPDFRKTIVR